MASTCTSVVKDFVIVGLQLKCAYAKPTDSEKSSSMLIHNTNVKCSESVEMTEIAITVVEKLH